MSLPLLRRGGEEGGGESEGRGGGGLGIVNVVPDYAHKLLEALRQLSESDEELRKLVEEALRLEETIVQVLVPSPHAAALDARYSSEVVTSKLSSALGVVEEYVLRNLREVQREESDEEKLRKIMKTSRIASIVAAESMALLHSLLLWNLPARARPALYNNLVGIDVV